MAITRSKTRSIMRTKKQIYRSRLKTSTCRGQKRCRIRNGCKKTKANVRPSYCRSLKNRSV